LVWAITRHAGIAKALNMSKTILITGSTDGIGRVAAVDLVRKGHHVLLHGRNAKKLESVKARLSKLGSVDAYPADLSQFSDVTKLVELVSNNYEKLDVLINNAGVLNSPHPITQDGLDVRFMVNTIAPYSLLKSLLPRISKTGRVLNVSSAAQAPVSKRALTGTERLAANAAYAQSKLALTMWSNHLARQNLEGPVILSVNPGSLLGTKMVKEGYGIEGKSINIGSDILVRLSLSDEFTSSNGLYFDNDIGAFGPPHPDALNAQKCQNLVETLEDVLNGVGAN